MLNKWGILVFVLVLTSCNNKSTINTAEDEVSGDIVLTEAQIKQTNIAFGVPDSVYISNTLRVRGLVDVLPTSQASVSLLVDGTITNVSVALGKSVKKGDVLAHYFSQTLLALQEKYVQMYYAFRTTKSEMERGKLLGEEALWSEKELIAMNNKFQSEKMMLQTLGNQLLFYGIDPNVLVATGLKTEFSIKAPINGIVSDISTHIGNFSTPEEVLMNIYDPKGEILRLKIMEKDIGDIAMGQSVEYATPNVSDQLYEATVYAIAGQINNELKSMDVLAKMNSQPLMLVPGQFVACDIMVNEKKVWGLPQTAVFKDDQGGSYVFLVHQKNNDRIFTKRFVTTGMNARTYVEIKSGLESLDGQVVIEGGYYLKAQNLLNE